jgi:hypothetical protein
MDIFPPNLFLIAAKRLFKGYVADYYRFYQLTAVQPCVENESGQTTKFFNVSSTPAATADPITPATLGPMANINSIFSGSSSIPTF